MSSVKFIRVKVSGSAESHRLVPHPSIISSFPLIIFSWCLELEFSSCTLTLLRIFGIGKFCAKKFIN